MAETFKFPEITAQILSLSQPLLSIKLTDTNYLLWKNQLENVAVANGLEGFLDGSLICPQQYIYIPSPSAISPVSESDSTPQAVTSSKTLNPDYSLWIRLDRTLKSWIYSSVSEGLLGQIVGLPSSLDIWHALSRICASTCRSRKMALKRELQNLKQDGSSISAYATKLKSISDNLAEIGEIVAEDQLKELFINGLNSDYNSFVASLSIQPQLPDFEELKGILRGHEMRIEEQNQVNSSSFLHVNTAAFSSSYPSNPAPFKPNLHTSSFPVQQYTYQTVPSPNPIQPSQFIPAQSSPNYYHSQRSQPGILGKPKSNSRFFGKGNFGNRQQQCQICDKFGHTARSCNYRHDSTFQPSNFPTQSNFRRAPPNFQANTAVLQYNQPYSHVQAAVQAPPSNYPSSQNNQHIQHNNITQPSNFLPPQAWFLDSGATHHLTHNLSSLSNPVAFEGQDQVLMGNGDGLQISHVGSSSLASNSGILSLSNVLYTPQIQNNLLSVTRLCSDNRVFVEFYADYFLVKDLQSKKILSQGVLDRGLYQFSCPAAQTSPCAFIASNNEEYNLWHSRLGHPSFEIINRIINSCNKKQFPLSVKNICNSCQLAKKSSFAFSQI
jgi:histone deacetylase 1/2